MEWRAVRTIAFLQSLRNRLADRSAPRPIRVLPRQAVVFARRAYDSLRILVELRTVVFLRRIFKLRFNEPAAHGDRVAFVFPNAAEKDLPSSGFCIEIPLPVMLHQRNGKRPLVASDRQSGANRTVPF